MLALLRSDSSSLGWSWVDEVGKENSWNMSAKIERYLKKEQLVSRHVQLFLFLFIMLCYSL